MREKRVTIQDVAKAADVSITTVSRFLNKRYESMSTATRERIARVIEELNYKPNILAQGLKGNKTKTVAIVVVNITYPFCVSVIRSLSTMLNEAGYRLMVADTGGDAAREQSLLESLMAQQVEGMIVQTNGDNNNLLGEIAKQLPVIIIDRQFDIPHTVNVITDNEDASRKLTHTLFQNGYNTVVYLTEPIAGISTRHGRLKGYESACRETGHEAIVVWVNKDESDSFKRALGEIQGLNLNKPAAIFTANGLIMLSFYPLIRDAEWNVPRDFGLATFDEPDWVRLTTPPLTCVRQPTTEIGHFSGEAILKALRASKGLKRRQVAVFPSEIMLGDSTRLS
ncbi:LacI family DNA-binding transcriptional regulator [Alicyclobacillus sp. SO9]|uniref:LacI family DNA-binding transcriptional regulator n=1 Tax=Alicyclobacillus sp. SO9 TaxID=2665646 RepID=UPI0018E788AE|nr:LacI family DNA-binding transcriptional regulator [Alicyclobacillus sp. SO9]QQE78144.1 LacI family DNA-binding transcriptional regulator [Alicyclobacillus sp. SO9]